MELLKEISKDRLIVMVTHNPALAQKYSSRIIRVLDGVITDDSDPLSPRRTGGQPGPGPGRGGGKPGQKDPQAHHVHRHLVRAVPQEPVYQKGPHPPSPPLRGPIGIIGIALILSVSQGMTDYINVMQEDALASYPLSIQATNVDLTSLIQTFMDLNVGESDHGRDAVYERPAVRDLVSAVYNLDVAQNDLRSFKTYLENQLADLSSPFREALSGIQYTYSIQPSVYTQNVDGTIIHSDTTQLMQELLVSVMDSSSLSTLMGGTGSAASGGTSGTAGTSGAAGMTTMMSGGMMNLWQELLPGGKRRGGEPPADPAV